MKLTVACVVVATILATSSLRAEPEVTGNTISWPDNGWYQVQTADGGTSICNGGRSCEVESGTYLVINHSTNERFTDIVVGNSGSGGGTAPDSAITVTGNTISWPDDGWYQVQTADGSTSVCNGGRSCDVEPGTYLVINHSTNERFTDIVVGNSGAGGGTAPDSAITVTGNTISWPDDGWYQVQTADGSTSICNGGRSCDAEPGTYLVINHSTNERFAGIDVGEDIVEETLDEKLLRFNSLAEKVGETVILEFNDQYSNGTLPSVTANECININYQWPYYSIGCFGDRWVNHFPINDLWVYKTDFIGYENTRDSYQLCSDSIGERNFRDCWLRNFTILNREGEIVYYTNSYLEFNHDFASGRIVLGTASGYTNDIKCYISDFRYHNPRSPIETELYYSEVTPDEAACKNQLDRKIRLFEEFLAK